MKRICFDIGCNLFHHTMDGFLNTPAEARDYYSSKGTDVKFYAATAWNQESEQFEDFLEARELFGCLSDADEIITFNGRTHDLIALEYFVDAGDMARIWQKPHHDLRGWNGQFRLRDAVGSVSPELLTDFEALCKKRKLELLEREIPLFTAQHLANTYRDAKMTLAVFEAHLLTNCKDFTFRD